MANPKSAARLQAILISDTPSKSQFGLICVAAWLATAILLATFCQSVTAQSLKKTYVAMDVDAKYLMELPPFDATDDVVADYKRRSSAAKRTQRDALIKVKAILESGGNLNDPIIADYFNGYVFPSMTTIDPRVLSKLGEARSDYLKDFLDDDVTGNIRNGLIDLTITGMQKICVNDRLHPAARLNAVYLIGMLDQVAAQRLPASLPTPSKAAYASLKKILDSADAVAFPPYLKVAALAGIQRHVEIDRVAGGSQISGPEKQALTTLIGSFLDAPKQDDLTYWLKRRSMQILGLLGDPRSIDRVLATLNSKDAEFWLRFDALETIGKLRLPTNGPKNKEASIAITEFVAGALEDESEAIKAAVDRLVYDQILFQDLDLRVTGTNYEEVDPTPSSTRGGEDEPGGMMGGLGGLGGRGGGGFGGRGGVPGGLAGGSSSAPAGGKLELPVYQLNLIRRRIKAIAFTGAKILGGETGQDGLSKLVDAEGKTFIRNVIQNLNSTLEKSNVGIVDLEAKKSDDELSFGDEQQPTVTKQLTDICVASAKKLNDYLLAEKGEPDPAETPATEPAAAAGAATEPAASKDDPNF